MKTKVFLLSIVFMMSVMGSQAVTAAAAPTGTTAAEDEVREDASHTGEESGGDTGKDGESDTDKTKVTDATGTTTSEASTTGTTTAGTNTDGTNAAGTATTGTNTIGTGTTSATTETTATVTTQDPPKVVIPDSNTKTDAQVDTTRGKFKITITPKKEGYVKDKMTLKIKVKKIDTNVPQTVMEKVEARIGAQGSWVDVTDDMTFEVTENCTVYVRVIDQYGNEYEKSKVVKCFDTVPPTLNAAVNEGLLTVTSYDTESGIDRVYVNGYKYKPDKNGITTIRLQKFDATYQNFYVYAMDKAGNPSTVYTIPNPYWVDPNAQKEDDNEDKPNPAAELPANATPQITGQATAQVASVTNEDGEDITNEVKSKQFYNIVTTDGQQYYLIIDMTPAQDKSGDTENTAYAGDGMLAGNHSPNPGIVYFLTSVSNQNLLNVVDDGEETLPYNSTAQVNGIDPYTMTPIMSQQQTVSEDTGAPLPQETEQPEKPQSFGWLKTVGLFILGLLLIVALALIITMFRKKGKPEQSDDELYDDGTEEPESLSELDEEEP